MVSKISSASLRLPLDVRLYSIALARIHPSSRAKAAPEPNAPGSVSVDIYSRRIQEGSPERGWLASPMRTAFPSKPISFSSLGPAKAENSFQSPSFAFVSASRTLGS